MTSRGSATNTREATETVDRSLDPSVRSEAGNRNSEAYRRAAAAGDARRAVLAKMQGDLSARRRPQDLVLKSEHAPSPRCALGPNLAIARASARGSPIAGRTRRGAEARRCLRSRACRRRLRCGSVATLAAARARSRCRLSDRPDRAGRKSESDPAIRAFQERWRRSMITVRPRMQGWSARSANR